MNDGPTSFEEAMSAAEETLDRAVKDRGARARHVTIATASPDGWPEARIVALRAADLASAKLRIQTDSATAKVASLAALPRAELHVWHPETCLQLRLRCEARLRRGAEVAEDWEAMPVPARTSYGKAPPPGAEISGPLDYEVTSDPQSFVVVDLRVLRFDLLFLGLVHKRAIFDWQDGWHGRWISP